MNSHHETLSQQEIQSIQHWLKEPAAFLFRRLMRSRSADAQVDAVRLFVSSLEGDYMDQAKEAAMQHKALEVFLQIMDDAMNGTNNFPYTISKIVIPDVTAEAIAENTTT
jgi:hypothetical protein